MMTALPFRIAPMPVQLIPKSNATAGLLAHIAVSKFADGLPLYRQEKIFHDLWGSIFPER